MIRPALPPPLRMPALVVVIAMAGCAANILINDNLDHGAGMDVWLAGLADPWQFFINLDLMAGLLMPLVWILWRERRNGLAVQIGWALVTLWWGNVVVAAYVLMALGEARGRPEVFFQGASAEAWIDRLSIPIRVLFGVLALGAAVGTVIGLLHSHTALLPAVGYLNGLGAVAYFFGLLALRRSAPLPTPSYERTAA